MESRRTTVPSSTVKSNPKVPPSTYNECPQVPVPSLSEKRTIGRIEELLNQTSPVNSWLSSCMFVVNLVKRPSNNREKSSSKPSLPSSQTGEGSIVPIAEIPDAVLPSPSLNDQYALVYSSKTGLSAPFTASTPVNEELSPIPLM